ncbi:MAG: hypothetical protein HYY24_27170 [Verrucomicrobia bacterium]|nr:hypothetical protein [Verrucomicrobiota bacterium]
MHTVTAMRRVAFRLTRTAALLGAALALGLCAQAAGSEIIYDNTRSGPEHYDSTQEFGEQIWLAGAARRLTDFAFVYFAENPAPDDDFVVRIYAQVPAGADQGPRWVPGKLLFEGSPSKLRPSYVTVRLSGLSLDVPDSITWTVAFRTAGGAGLVHANPPSVGANPNDLWVNEGAPDSPRWKLTVRDGSDGKPVGNFEAQFTADPSPGLTILTQPASQTARRGEDVLLAATVAGDAPISYQWRFQDAHLPSETNAVLRLTKVLDTQAGAYTVWATNRVGKVRSEVAVLSVRPPVPPRLFVPAPLTDGDIRLAFAGEDGQRYALDTSADLGTWEEVAVVTTSTGVGSYVHTQAARASAAFYRLRSLTD